MEDDETKELLLEQIRATNRATYATRALTTFIVYEAAYAVASAVTIGIGLVPVAALEEPWWFFVVLGGLIAIAGLIHSFSAAFDGLSNSEVKGFTLKTGKPPTGSPSGGSGPRKKSQQEIDAWERRSQAEKDRYRRLYGIESETEAGKCSCGTDVRKKAGGSTVGNSYVCRECGLPIFDY